MEAESIQCTGVCRLAEGHSISAVTASFSVLKKTKIKAYMVTCMSFSWLIEKQVWLQQSDNAIMHVNGYPTMHCFQNPTHSVNDSV